LETAAKYFREQNCGMDEKIVEGQVLNPMRNEADMPKG
jgi:hypothetical protein